MATPKGALMAELVPIPSPGSAVYYGLPGSPLVVIAHDWYGRLPWLEPYATALASQGYRVVVPDFYGGFATIDPETAAELRDDLDAEDALATIDDLVAESRLEGSTRVGLVGFSMGGWIALLHAQGGDADAVVAYYATLGTEEHGIIPCPVLLNLAENDEFQPGAEPESFVARLEDHGTPVTEFVYLGTEHSFANASLSGSLDNRAAALAFARTSSFFDKHLVD
jgi:carboxymethylenebutenolidase